MNGRIGRVVLVSSLVLNVFLIGGIAGGAYQWFVAHGQANAAVAPSSRALRFAAADLSTQRQNQFVDGLKAARRDAHQFALEGRDDRREVLRLLAAPQLDRVALDMALNRTREADIALRSRVEQSVADFAATLTPDERVTFAEGLKQRGEWRLAQAQQAQQEAQQQARQPKASDAPASE